MPGLKARGSGELDGDHVAQSVVTPGDRLGVGVGGGCVPWCSPGVNTRPSRSSRGSTGSPWPHPAGGPRPVGMVGRAVGGARRCLGTAAVVLLVDLRSSPDPGGIVAAWRDLRRAGPGSGGARPRQLRAGSRRAGPGCRGPAPVRSRTHCAPDKVLRRYRGCPWRLGDIVAAALVLLRHEHRRTT
jgi:hypothetical protein